MLRTSMCNWCLKSITMALWMIADFTNSFNWSDTYNMSFPITLAVGFHNDELMFKLFSHVNGLISCTTYV